VHQEEEEDRDSGDSVENPRPHSGFSAIKGTCGLFGHVILLLWRALSSANLYKSKPPWARFIS
jgi:hypothetical protein